MKKSIKKAALTTLSAVAILSAVPSAFCAPYGKNQNVNERGHIDSFNIMVVGKYLSSVEDFRNLSRLKKYQNLLSKYRYNPVEINSREQLALFPNIETCRIGKFEKDFLTKFPNETIKTMIYLPNSFNSFQFRDVLKDNGIVDENEEINDNWERTFELCSENPIEGCKITFTDGDKTIVFMFDPCAGGALAGSIAYNQFLKNYGVKEEELSVADINVSRVFTIPNSVTSIRKFAFFGCKNLTTINIPNSVTIIGEDVFAYCSNLTNVNIPNSVTSIEKSTFEYCESLTNLNIPDSVTSIGEYAFHGCERLTNINIPNTVTSIGEYAFSGCERLTNINIPNTVTSIEKCAFAGCRSLTNINIPDTVTSIGKSAFAYCVNLNNVTIPNSVTSIEEGAFDFCRNLTNVTIPTSVTDLAEDAFENCSNLNHIEFNGQVYDSVDSFMQAFNDYKASQQ